jgi:hypothetical protein
MLKIEPQTQNDQTYITFPINIDTIWYFKGQNNSFGQEHVQSIDIFEWAL